MFANHHSEYYKLDLFDRTVLSLGRATFTIAIDGMLEILTVGNNYQEGHAITTRGMATTTIKGVMVHVTLDNFNTEIVAINAVLFVIWKITL